MTSKDDIKGLVSLKLLRPLLKTYNLLWGQYGGGGGDLHIRYCVYGLTKVSRPMITRQLTDLFIQMVLRLICCQVAEISAA
jgi:hypothetical protein